MPIADSVFQGIGDTRLPVVAADITDTLLPLDPGGAKLMALFKSAINSEYSAAWHVLSDALPAGHTLADSDPVADTLEVEPSPQVMQQRKATFPLLCLYRTGDATYESLTLQEDRLNQEWGLDYILGPLDIGDLRKLSPICVAVGKLLRIVIRQRGHNSYESGVLQFGTDKGGFATVELESQQGPGQASFAGDEGGTLYYAISFKLKTTEVTNDDLGAFGQIDAVDVSIGVGNATEILPDLIQSTTATEPPEG